MFWSSLLQAIVCLCSYIVLQLTCFVVMVVVKTEKAYRLTRLFYLSKVKKM